MLPGMLQPFSLLLLALPLSACASVDAQSLAANVEPPSAADIGLPEHLVPRRPALSPDGTKLAYTHGGDIWVANVADGQATRLTAHAGFDTSPIWSPDGSQIAFSGKRHGNFDVFVIAASGGEPKRLTWISENEVIHGWVNQSTLLTGMTRERWYNRYGRAQGLWTVNTAGQTPQLFGDFPAGRSAVSSDGNTVVYEKGSGDQRRRAYRGAAANDLWVFERNSGQHRQLTKTDGSEFCPQISADGKTVYFLSDQKSSENPGARDLGLWSMPISGGKAKLVYHPGNMTSLRYCSVNSNANIAVCELGDGLVRIDLAAGTGTRLPVYGGLDSSIPVSQNVTVSGGASELAVSPDGETIAFVAKGDIYALRKHDKIERATRITQALAMDSNPVWGDDGKTLMFVSERDGNNEIYQAKTQDEETPFYLERNFTIKRLTNTPADETSVSLSPDGKTLAWVQGNGKLVVGDPESLAVTREIYSGFEGPDYSWSPDSKWLAFSVSDDDFNVEVYLSLVSVEGVAADAPGVKPYNLTMHPDDDTAPQWSPDGRKIAFTSRRRMLDETDVWVCYLRKEDVEMTERERLEAEEARAKAKKEKAKKEKEAKEKAKKEEPKKDDPTNAKEGGKAEEPAAEKQEPKADEAKTDGDKKEDEEEAEEVEPVVIDFDGLRDRLRRLTRNEGNESAIGWHNESEKVYYNASLGTRLTSGSSGDTGFFEVDIYEKDPEKLSPTTVSSFTSADQEVYYVQSGKVKGRGSKETTYPFAVRIRENRRAIREAVLEQGWGVLNDWFYDQGFHGIDWNAARLKWKPVVTAASTPEDFEDLMNWMFGELNASHMGFYGQGGLAAAETDATSTGGLGVVWDYSYAGPGRKVLEVLPDMPASREASRLQFGDLILAVDGVALAEDGNWDRLMAGTTGNETMLTVSTDGEEHQVLIRPSASSSMRTALYDRRERNLRNEVEQSSDAKLGYIHIQAMGTPSLLEFERKLYAAGNGRDALIIDVRDNGGGWTTDMVLNMLMVNDHAFTIPRGGGVGYPQGRRIFGTWNKPVVVLCNENSYSNAEIFSWAIKTLGRGPLVGKQTFGAVISTGGAGLMDGSFVRMPFRGWYVKDKNSTNMELNGCPPDYAVENLPEDFGIQRDRQLEKAIEIGLSLVE